MNRGVMSQRDIEELIDHSGGLCRGQISFLQFFRICSIASIEPDWSCPGIPLI
jgi:hypothetical protein